MEALGQLDAEQKKTSDTIMQMFELAKKLRISSAAKLLQASKGRIEGATGKFAKVALEGVTSRQILAPAPRSTGKSVSEGLGLRWAADLVDLSQNSKGRDGVNKYAIMAIDIFSREVFASAIPNKRPETVNTAFMDLIEIPDGMQAKVTTDKGAEFSRLGEADPGIVHVTKSPSDPNGIAVLDRAMQTIKVDISADLADGDHKYWDDALDPVVESYNNRPHSFTIVPPSQVENSETAEFRLLQKNSAGFVINRSQTNARTAQLKEAGMFRAYEPTPRSFNPRWGKAFNLKSVKGDVVTNTSGKEFALKQVQAVPKGSTEPIGKLTDPTISRKARYQERANDVVEMLANRGSQMTLVAYEQAIRGGDAENLIKLLRRNNITIRGFLKIYPELFVVRNANVMLKTQAAAAPEPAAPEPPPPPPPPPAAPRRRITLVGGDDPQVQRNFAEALRLQGRLEEEDARKARARARVVGIREAYPGDRLAP